VIDQHRRYGQTETEEENVTRKNPKAGRLASMEAVVLLALGVVAPAMASWAVTDRTDRTVRE
jgi:hypothetical protein